MKSPGGVVPNPSLEMYSSSISEGYSIEISSSFRRRG